MNNSGFFVLSGVVAGVVLSLQATCMAGNGFFSFTGLEIDRSASGTFSGPADTVEMRKLLNRASELKDTDHREAVNCLRTCLQRAQRANQRDWISMANTHLGKQFMRAGEMDSAGVVFSNALAFESSAKPAVNPFLAVANFNLGTYNKRTGKYRISNDYYYRSAQLEAAAGNLRRVLSSWLNIGANFQYIGETDSAVACYDRGMVLATQLKDTSMLESLTTNFAIIYETKGEYGKSLSYLEKSLSYVDAGGFDAANIYANTASIYYYQGQMSRAVANYERAIEIFKNTGAEKEYAMTLLNFSTVLTDEKLFAKALAYQEKAAAIFRKIGNDDLLSTALLNMGSVYKSSNRLDEAMARFSEALVLAKKVENLNNVATACFNLAAIFKIKGDYQSALSNNEKALELFVKIGDERLIAQGIAAKGALLSRTGDYAAAKVALEKALRLSEDIGSIEVQISALENLIEMVSLKNDGGVTFGYLRKLSTLTDSLRAAENSKAARDLIVRYEVREKEDSIRFQALALERQRELNTEKEKVNAQQARLLQLSVTGVVMISALAGLAFRNYRKKRKAYELLNTHKTTIEQKNAENELLLSEIHHRVKNNLQVVMSLLSLQERNMTDESARAAITEGKERVRAMELVHKMLYQGNNYSGIEIHEYVAKLVAGIKETFGISGDDVEFNIDVAKLRLDVDTVVPIGLMLNELIVNALKHADLTSQGFVVKIGVQADEKGRLSVTVSDNGKGRVADIEKSNAFGMRIVRALTRQIGGDLTIRENDGLHFNMVTGNFRLE